MGLAPQCKKWVSFDTLPISEPALLEAWFDDTLHGDVELLNPLRKQTFLRHQSYYF